MVKFLLILTCLLSSLCWAQDRIVFIGDSLTEGYGIEKQFSYPQLVQDKLISEGKNYKVINGGVSGSTTASGISRLKWFLKGEIKILVLVLGANDGLRGIKVEESEKNLVQVIELAQKKKIKVILGGMQIPPNYGKEYTENFKAIYPRLAKKYNLKLIPFIIKGVAGKRELNISDGIHPNKKGHQVISETVYKYLKEIL
jgi:acyl-CoA thioesterase-1